MIIKVRGEDVEVPENENIIFNGKVFILEEKAVRIPKKEIARLKKDGALKLVGKKIGYFGIELKVFRLIEHQEEL